MIIAREDFMMTVLSCGQLDLSFLDKIQYDMCDVFERLNEVGIDSPSLGSLMQAVFELGFDDIRDEVDTRICELEAVLNERELDDDEENELKQLRGLDPYEDFRTYHNFLDTHVWCEAHGEIYKAYMSEALNRFYENTGFEVAYEEKNS